ncbi:MAG: response regulator [Hyphomicrobiales bacterium]|nr:response regulator [Hyphomicrobiales bacterium]
MSPSVAPESSPSGAVEGADEDAAPELSDAPAVEADASPVASTAPEQPAPEQPVLEQPVLEQPLPEQSPEPAPVGRRILTIDDSKTIRQMLKLTLAQAGFTVLQAVDGQDGLEVLRKEEVDVVITDINMPKLDGYGVIRQIREDPTYDDTPILVLSTESDQENKNVARDAGATGWIVKPFVPDQLVDVIRKVCP